MISKLLAATAAFMSALMQSIINATWVEWLILTVGGILGWFVGEFTPAFPLIVIATLFVLYDAWSAYELDKRVHIRYPDQTKRHEAKFVSYKFRTVIPTLIERFVIIILAYCVQRWVFVDLYVPMSYIAAGVVCAEQALSIAENKASCRLPGDKHARIWKMLAHVLIDKTERHFDVDLGPEAHNHHHHAPGFPSDGYDASAPNMSDVVTEQPTEIEPYNDGPKA